MVLSVEFFGPGATEVVGADGEVFTTVALAARLGREVDGVPGTEAAIGARFDVAAVAAPDGRGAVGRVAAGVPGADGAVGAVEFSRRPVKESVPPSREVL